MQNYASLFGLYSSLFQESLSYNIFSSRSSVTHPTVSKGPKKFPGKYSASIRQRNNRRKAQRKSVVRRRKKNG